MQFNKQNSFFVKIDMLKFHPKFAVDRSIDSDGKPIKHTLMISLTGQNYGTELPTRYNPLALALHGSLSFSGCCLDNFHTQGLGSCSDITHKLLRRIHPPTVTGLKKRLGTAVQMTALTWN